MIEPPIEQGEAVATQPSAGGGDVAASDEQAGGAQQQLATALLITGVVVLAWTLLRHRIRRTNRERAAANTRPSERIERTREVAASRSVALDGLLVDAEELVRELAAKLENKAARVESLLDRAEARLAEMEARQAHLDDRAGEGISAEPADPLAAQVYELADSGLEANEIARRTGQGAGEVRLMLAMRGRRAV